MNKDINIHFRAFYDENATVWVAISDDQAMTTEAASKEALKQKLIELVPDVLDARGIKNAEGRIFVDWQAMTTYETTEIVAA